MTKAVNIPLLIIFVNYAITNYAFTEKYLAILDPIDKWLCYLCRKLFTVVTDHSALQWLNIVKNRQGRLFRCSLKLSMHDVNIKRRNCISNVEADALSGAPVVQILSPTNLQKRNN